MKYLAIAFLAYAAVGCASDPAKRAAVAEHEVERLVRPSKPLSDFRDYELKPITLTSVVMADDDKVRVAEELGRKLNARIVPLLNRWKSQKTSISEGSVLVVEPKILELKVISGSARFWLGALMGDSFVDMDLKLTDAATGQVIATPRIHKTADSWGGAWSIGATDRNLLDYITDIAYRYLEVNYTFNAPR